MQIKTKITYDANKLAKKMPKMIAEVMKRFAREVATQSKGHIDKGLKPAWSSYPWGIYGSIYAKKKTSKKIFKDFGKSMTRFFKKNI